MKPKLYLSLIAVFGLLFLSGCQRPTTFQHAISLHMPPPTEGCDPNMPAPEPIDPLDILSAIEKVAGKSGLKPYTASADEASLLDIADSDLLDDTSTSQNTTEWKHPDLAVYLTVIRKPDEILILLNHTPDEIGKTNPDAQKLFAMTEKQLAEMIKTIEFSTD